MLRLEPGERPAIVKGEKRILDREEIARLLDAAGRYRTPPKRL
jgi:hypothetical protein